jgi:ABC-type antimicrobial peptide transport system permease subunit
MGVYGVMAYYVQQHAKDISIRIALGGGRAAVARLVVSRGTRLVVAGVAVGLFIAFNVARLTSTLLFGVRPSDPATFAAVAALMIGVAVVACALPASRAVTAEPAMVLRQE